MCEFVFSTSSYDVKHFCKVSQKIPSTVFKLQSGHDSNTKITIFNVQRTITPKVGKPQLHFSCSAHLFMVVNISVKLRKNILYGFQITRRTRPLSRSDRQTDRQTDRRPWQKQYVSWPWKRVVYNNGTFAEEVKKSAIFLSLTWR